MKLFYKSLLNQKLKFLYFNLDCKKRSLNKNLKKWILNLFDKCVKTKTL